MAKWSNSSVNPLRKPLRCFVRLPENILQAGQRFLNVIHFSGPVYCQLEMTNVLGDQAAAKRRKIKKKKPEYSSTKTVEISYGVCHEVLAEDTDMPRIAAKFVPRLMTNDQKQRLVNVCLEI
jgi:hypothetical protein